MSSRLIAIAALSLGCGGASADDDPDGGVVEPDGGAELGTATQVSGPTPCDQRFECYELAISCSGALEEMNVNVRVGEPDGAGLGTVVLTSGGGGQAFWARGGGPALDSLADLNAAGYRTVELGWIGRWFDGTSVEEGAARLACRVATAADWVHENLHQAGGFCAAGGSGGAAQISYLVSHYGFDDRLDLLVPIEGPPFARIDLGCLPSPGDPPALNYGEPGVRTDRFDASYGFSDLEGPCSLEDETFRDSFEDASVAHGVRDFEHPTTRVRLLFGSLGNVSAASSRNGSKRRILHKR